MFSSVSSTGSGPPDVTVTDEGKLQIYPMGISAGACLIMSTMEWAQLVTQVEVARRKDLKKVFK